MKKTHPSTAQFLVSFWKNAEKSSPEKAFVQAKEQVEHAKTRAELDALEECVIHFFDAFPHKQRTLSAHISSKKYEKQ